MNSQFFIKQVETAMDLPLPSYMTKSSAGMDLYANISENIILSPLMRTLVPTGIKISIPDDYEAQIRPRSGLALNHGIILPNSPGTIDSDYRGEIKVILLNLGSDEFIIKRGDRIAQLVISTISKVNWIKTNELPLTERGEGGFGHTGI